ncbi:unnamed protein product [Pocillopora meandrina]|uniref:FZ domain-containing protein n=1 Tax=Pocillopora meandrina TaxID=46732 RepID=A0AAU9XIP8_9CNID|nr:unnamed protein product [Pocillopora meandrina]
MPVHSPALPGCFLIKIIVLLICSLSILTVVCDESIEGKCVSLANGHFDFCTKGGYNSTLSFPKVFTAKRQAEVAGFLTFMIEEWRNCSTLSLVTAMECSFFVPKCSSKGTRVYPCRRVCGELLKQCQNDTSDYRELYMDLLLASCLILPNETASSEKCFEPPGFTPNNNISSPLDRGCQNLIFPACKNLGFYNHTIFAESVQKKFYKIFHNKTYGDGQDLDQDFPFFVRMQAAKFPDCSTDIKKLFCGDLFPPCFPEEGSPKLKTLCRSVCDDIQRKCPDFFSDNFMGAEICAFLAPGNTSHGFCDHTDWPEPFSWLRYYKEDRFTEPSTEPPSVEHIDEGPKGWVVAVAVLTTLIIVALGLAALIWWKWRGVTPASWLGYKRQQDFTTEE